MTYNKYRCSKHQEEVKPPRLCHTCQRIDVERKIATKLVKALLDAGYALATDEGEHHFYGESNPTRDHQTVLDALMTTDEEHLGVFDAEEATGQLRVARPFGWVYLVYGNDGWDVISDYTVNLEDVLKSVNDYADTFAV